jgi:EAL domain-containing protein (putative c-di-GMP-specific phosphodiesterase class I)
VNVRNSLSTQLLESELANVSSVEALRDVLRFLNTHEFGLGGDNSQVGRSESGSEYGDDGPLHIIDNAIVATYAGLLLGSAFQPIVASDDRVVGHKALVTAKSSARHDFSFVDFPDTPKIAAATRDRNDVIYRDRLTRTMHALNYIASGLSDDLYLNVNPQHLQSVRQNHGEVFEKILAQCGLQPNRIVLEIPEYAVADKQHLRAAIKAWQQRHYRIAIDAGAAQTQLTSVLNLKPDIIKFDGSFVAKFSDVEASQNQLEKMIGRIRESGVHAIAAGVDSAALFDEARKYRFFALHGKWLTDHVVGDSLADGALVGSNL